MIILLMEVKIHHSWRQRLNSEFSKEYFQKLVAFIKSEYRSNTVYPSGPLIFRAFDECPLDKVKVVIVGQDPYHGNGQANGLSFSVGREVSIPPSLKNIFKELKNDIGKDVPSNGELDHWAKQGVLLLNATLTVRAGSAGSHQGYGWEEFTDSVIHALNDEKVHLVFILWGKYAQEKGNFIDREKHLVIESAHPSPYSAERGFFGSRPFSRTNEYLNKNGIEEISW